MKYATFDETGVLHLRLIAGVHRIPADAVQVDEDMWLRLTQEDDGIWMLSDGAISKHPFEAPDFSGLERAWRDAELMEVMWLRDRHRDQLDINADTTLSSEQFSELLVYMQALRDWPQANAFPDPAARPVAPLWISEAKR